jgi:hypothetical protein
MQKILAAAIMALLMASPALAEEKKAAAETKAAKTAEKPAKPTSDQIAAAKKAAEEQPTGDEYDDPEADAKLEAMKKLAKKKKCVEVVMHKEVLPFFGKETTVRASQEITVEWERDDIVSGRAEVLDTHSRCTEVVGNLIVMCTTVTALCYHEQPKDVGKLETLSDVEKQRAAAQAVKERAEQNEAAKAEAAQKAEAVKKKTAKASGGDARKAAAAKADATPSDETKPQ